MRCQTTLPGVCEELTRGIEVKDAVLSSSRLYSGVYAWSSYLGEVGNGDDTFLLPSVVVIRPIFMKERIAMLTLCLPLSDVAILHSIRHSKRALQNLGSCQPSLT